MTRKHFEAIAAIVKTQMDGGPTQRRTAQRIAMKLAIEFAKQNPNFKRELFMKACGM
jgi:hypothetical protein